MRETYLDGLRGWAALVVVLCHAGEVFWPTWHPGFFPLLTDGSFSVFIFFVLSGYVLSVGFFRTGERRAVVDLALRRYPRLTVPIFGASCLAMVLMALGWMRNIPASKVAYSAWSRARFHADGGRHSSRSRAAVQAIAGSVPDDGGQNSILIAGSCSCAG